MAAVTTEAVRCIVKEELAGFKKDAIEPIITHLATLNGAVEANTTWRIRAQGFIVAVVLFGGFMLSSGFLERLWPE